MDEKKKLVLPEWAQILREISDEDPEGYSIEAVKSKLNLEFLRGMAWMYNYTVHIVPANLDPNYDYPIIRKLEEEIQEKVFEDISMYLMSEIREVMVSMLDDESFRDLSHEEIREDAEPVKPLSEMVGEEKPDKRQDKKRSRRARGTVSGNH